MADKFFKEQKEQSAVKSLIVSKYFLAWAKIVLPQSKMYGNGKIAYIDLFSGPGYYDDGSESTPILVLKKAISQKDVSGNLVTIFSDKEEEYVASLKNAINGLPGIDNLKYKPQVIFKRSMIQSLLDLKKLIWFQLSFF